MSLPSDHHHLTKRTSPDPLFQQLHQLVQEIIIPGTETLISALVIRLEECINADNNNNIASWAKVKNRLTDSEPEIIECFTNALTQDQQVDQNQDTVVLELMDNEELDQKLVWLNAAHYFENSENAQYICHIRSSLGSLYPQLKGTLPATPERLCESFSTAIALLNPDEDVAQQLFVWFTDHFKSTANELWQKANRLLSEENHASGKKPVNTSLPSELDQEQQALPHSTTTDPELMDNPAAQLVSRGDNLLVEDETSSKKQNNTVTSTDLLKILNTLQAEMIDQLISPTNIREAIIKKLAGEKVTAQLRQQQEDRINTVGWLFHHILASENLPGELTKVIALLHIPILKQAIADDAFLANHHHPARCLLIILSSSSKYCQEPALGDHVLMLMEHTVRTILADHDATPDIFQECLTGFQHNLKEILQTHHTAQDGAPKHEEPTQVVAKNEANECHKSVSLPDTNELTEEIVLFSDTFESTAETEEKLSEPSNKDQQPEEQQVNTQQEPTPTEILHCGQWVEFIGQGDAHRLRCKLSRVSEDRQRYIFVNRSGMTVAQRSASELQKEIAGGSLQILAEHPIFDRAIQAVMGHFKKQPLKR